MEDNFTIDEFDSLQENGSDYVEENESDSVEELQPLEVSPKPNVITGNPLIELPDGSFITLEEYNLFLESLKSEDLTADGEVAAFYDITEEDFVHLKEYTQLTAQYSEAILDKLEFWEQKQEESSLLTIVNKPLESYSTQEGLLLLIFLSFFLFGLFTFIKNLYFKIR